jgi:hypothetical protein
VLTHVPLNPVTSSVYLVTQMSPAHWPDRTTNEVLGCEGVKGVWLNAQNLVCATHRPHLLCVCLCLCVTHTRLSSTVLLRE